MCTVSVVINCYNYGHFVVEAIESALAQSFPPAEVVVVDDGSTDETPRILEERFGDDPKVKVLLKSNGGQLSAFVAGLEHASGKVICFLDADDKYERNHVESVVKAFSEHKDVDFVFTAHRLFGEADQVVQYAPEDVSLGFSLIATLKDRAYVGSVTSTLAMRRSLAQTLLPALRQAARRWRIRADDCLVYGSSLAGCKKYYLAEPTVLYRVHGGNGFFRRAESMEENYAHGLRRDTFSQLLADHLGLGPEVRLRVLLEFLSIERPTREQYRAYVRLNRKIHDSPLKFLKTRIRLYQHYRRNRASWDKGGLVHSPMSTGGRI